MKVKELKKLLLEVDDDLDVFIPLNAEFDGMFRSPCIEETGVSCIADNDDDAEEDLDDSIPQRKVFMILPHGFSLEQEGPPPELN